MFSRGAKHTSHPSVSDGHAAWHVARACRVVPQVPVVALHRHLVHLLSHHGVRRVPSDAETTVRQYAEVRD